MKKKITSRILKEELAFPDKREMKTASFLAKKLKTNILFLAPSRVAGVKTPDLKINNEFWEIKTPTGKSSRTISNNFREAKKQATNIIFDLRDINLPTDRALSRVKYIFNLSQVKSTKKIMIITKTGQLFTFTK